MTRNNEEEEAKYKPPQLEPTTAQCNCGAVKLTLSNPKLTMACHCHDCRARSGAAMAQVVTSKSSDVTIDTTAKDQISIFGKFHPDGSNKGPRVNFCKTCGTNTHFTSFGGKVIQVPIHLTGLKDTLQDASSFHLWASSAVPTSQAIFDNTSVPVFEGMPTGAPMEAFMALIKE